MPKVTKGKKTEGKNNFPLAHYSASSMIKFTSNPILFKIEQINKDRFDTSMGISGVIGQSFHKAMEVYYGGNDEVAITSEQEAIEMGLKVGMDFLEKYNDGFIQFSTTVPNKQKAFEIFAFAFNSYVQEKPWGKEEELISCEEKLEELIDIEWKGKHLSLPVKLKGYTDKIVRKDKKIKVIDYKTTRSFSNPDKIDGAKIIQAIQYYFLVYARLGEEPYSMIYEEVKTSKNRDGSPQVKEYEIVYADNELFFDFYLRLYEDITKALNGEMVYVPNINALYDNEVALIAYIHRLDVTEEQARLMKKHKVENITDLLKKKIQSAGSMKKLLKMVEQKFISAQNLNYEKMENQEKIQTKMLEHGMMLQFDSKIEGATVDLYKYTPSIGLKMSKLKGFVEDIEQVLGTTGIRVLAPIPNTTLIGYEVPKKERTFPALPKGKGFEIAIGQNIMGKPHKFDIRKAPHMLIAGASGSGKSVFLNSIIEQLLRLTKKESEIYLFDPKIVELAKYQDGKNVIAYETDIMEIHMTLESLVKEMNIRYEVLSKAKARNIEEHGGMPYKFVIIDEYGDLIMQNYIDVKTIKTGKIFLSGPRKGEEETKTIKTNISEAINKNVLLLAQKARAAGIHIIIATQRPSVDVITGTIKANFPTKVAFRTAKAIDSTVLLDEKGAEKLTGKGDMIFSSEDGTERLQGYLV